MKEKRQITLQKYMQKNVIGTETGKYLIYIIIGVGILLGSKYVLNGLAETIKSFKNLKRSIKE